MSDDARLVRGGCRCGAVRFAATGEPNKVAYCHCDSCRKATGAPVSVNVMFEARQFRFTAGAPRSYESSPGVQRAFCERCGTPLTWSGIWHERRFVFCYVGTLDDPASFEPDRHAFCDHRLAWFDVADHLPRYPATSPDGSGVGSGVGPTHPVD